MLTARLNLLTVCLYPTRGLTAQDFLLFIKFILSIFLMQELTSISTPSFFTLVKYGTLFFYLFFHLLMTWSLSQEDCKKSSHVGPQPSASISPNVLFTWSYDKQNSVYLFLLTLYKYLFNIEKENNKMIKKTATSGPVAIWICLGETSVLYRVKLWVERLLVTLKCFSRKLHCNKRTKA